jgi:gliding motility-associated-like protein
VNGCSATAPIQVFVNPLPVATIFGSQQGCSDAWGSSYTTSAQNNVVYQWSANGGSISGSNGQDHVNILWNNTGITLVNLLTLNTTTGCRSTTSLQVLVDSMPQIHVTANNFTGCAPLNAVLGSSPQSPSYTYQWWFGDDGSSSFDPVATHSFTEPGNYNITLVASNNSGCRDTVDAMVMVYNTPVADFDLNVSDDFYPEDESSFTLQNNSTGGIQYLWSFGDGHTTTEFQPSYQYNGAGSFHVMLITTNAFGCRDSMLKAIEIRVPESVYIPNAFTPNGDSKNDGFSVYIENIVELKVSIFDRWGEEVYSSNEKNFVWDGTYFGHKVQEGVYFYKIAAKGFHGHKFERVGTVSVVR